jgi:hypothetical protein
VGLADPVPRAESPPFLAHGPEGDSAFLGGHSALWSPLHLFPETPLTTGIGVRLSDPITTQSTSRDGQAGYCLSCG